jgi:hypothetical protein
MSHQLGLSRNWRNDLVRVVLDSLATRADVDCRAHLKELIQNEVAALPDDRHRNKAKIVADISALVARIARNNDVRPRPHDNSKEGFVQIPPSMSSGERRPADQTGAASITTMQPSADAASLSHSNKDNLVSRMHNALELQMRAKQASTNTRTVCYVTSSGRGSNIETSL